jgi:O-antigen/teichoic acid export membrane protein
MNLTIQLKAVPLFLTNAFEIAVPFIRTLIFTHLLTPYEFGFTSALAATFATYSQITDIGISSFVFSSPRAVYAEVIAGAHAVAIVRGFSVTLLILLFSKPVSCTFGACGDWASFASLAPIMLVNSFEHFEIRVATFRDYRYWPPLLASFVSHGSGLIALFLITYFFRNYYGFIAYLLVQSFAYVLASHRMARGPYELNYKTPYVRKAVTFGLPLLFSAIGLAIMSQGDRWIVGSFMGLPFLGLYAVVTLAAYVPIIGLIKMIGPVAFAGLHNADAQSGQFSARLQLYCRVIPILATTYALAIIGLYPILVPAVFGHRFAISNEAIFLLALIAFLRIVRSEPQTSLLFTKQRTRTLAIVGQAPFIGLLATALFAIARPSLEFILIGTLIGEVAALCAIGIASRSLLKSAIFDHLFSILAMLLIILAASALVLGSQSALTTVAILAAFQIVVFACALLWLPRAYKRAYSVLT